jgi:hypothetical protein
VNRGKLGNALYAVKGKMMKWRGSKENAFRMLFIDNVRYLGDMEDALKEDAGAEPAEREEEAA